MTLKPDQTARLIEQALNGDRQALETLLESVTDQVFHLSLRMLGAIPDAEDATQEILIKVMTGISSFEQRSAFSTWVFRIAVNHLRSYRKGMFSQHPLSFEFYGADIASGREKDVPDLSRGVDGALLERELKLSCSNVMLQCFDAETRLIFILGTMFKVDSRVAGDILGLSPEAYRQRLSRARKTMAAFMDEYCGLGGRGLCRCQRRTNYAIATHRLDPENLAYSALEEADGALHSFTDEMEQIDGLSLVFSSLPAYRATPNARRFFSDLLESGRFSFLSRDEGGI